MIGEGDSREVLMRKLSVFNLMTLDGYVSGVDGDISWHNVDAEFNDYAVQTTRMGHTLLFGRVTYELMTRYWPTPEALKKDPIVAEHMNSAPKVVFSRTLKEALWNRTRLVSDDILAEIRRMKEQPGKDLTILGSGSIVAQATQADLVDEYEILLNPVILGKGKTMFDGVKERLKLRLTGSRTFANGNVLLHYAR
jgi:dihydrofolate reductase